MKTKCEHKFVAVNSQRVEKVIIGASPMQEQPVVLNTPVIFCEKCGLIVDELYETKLKEEL